MKKNKAFTLIELLVTILILGITVIIGVVSVNAIINNSKEKKDDLNIENILLSSKNYTLEFKNEDKYWFVDNSNDDMEYSCTTIGMLINKGLLKEKILDTIINNKVITKDTSVLIKRDRLTKVNNDIDIIFDSVSCKEDASIKVNFNILSEMEENSWFKEDVKINIDIENDSQIDKNNITYFVKENDSKKDALINNISGEEGSNWDINVGNEGVNLDLCVTINTLKDKLVTYCLSETQDKYKMDKTKPNSPELTLDTLTNKYKINSSNAKDNVTSESNLRYYITYDETLNEKEHLLDSNTRINEKVVQLMF